MTGALGQTRQAAARAYGTPRLQALYAGAGEGRNREQQTWRQHQARVTATAAPIANAVQDELDEPGVQPPRPGMRLPSRSPAPPAALMAGRPPWRPTGSTA